MSNAVELINLSCHFGSVRAVDGVDLEVREGERRAIIGPNGAGKTTLFHLLSGEAPATAGRILLFGRDVTRLPSYRRTALGIGRTYQVTNLFPRLSVLENALLAVFGLRPEKYDPFRPASQHRKVVDEARHAVFFDRWFTEVLGKDRLRVGTEHGLHSMVLQRSADLAHSELKTGDEVRVDSNYRMALEMLSSPKSHEHYLDTVPEL
ncbi:MAG: hypothetical protein C4345_11960, partial [Chloroflexota bacterium]